MPTCLFPPPIVAIGAGRVAVDDVVPGSNRFAFDLLGKLGGPPGNLAFSPYSLSNALAMTSLGAAGPTAREMAATLHLPAADAGLETSFAALRARVEGKATGLDVANALWGQQGLSYRPEFLRRAKSGFGAGLRPVDFQGDPAGAVGAINAWVEARTRDKIKDLLAPSDVKPGTDLLLTNALYFRGAWGVPFPKGATKDEPFNDGATSKPVPMMHLVDSFPYLDGGTFQALELPYIGGELAMVLLLPKGPDGLAALEASTTGDALAGWLAKLARVRVEVTLPRFRLKGAAELSGVLGALGMASAFGPAADFSGITVDRKLHLSAVLHKVFVEVNEEGTEAAAATGVIMRRSLAMTVQAPPVPFCADHPFLFLIRHVGTGSIVFLGRVASPVTP